MEKDKVTSQLKFDITIHYKESDSTLSLKNVEYNYFLNAFKNYSKKLENNINQGNYVKSIRSARKVNFNPYNNLYSR